MKLLLYCTKAKPYLYQGFAKPMHTKDKNNPFNYNWNLNNKISERMRLNGKIVAECDFEVEEIYLNNNVIMGTKTLNSYDLVVKSKVEIEQMRNYLKGENGYAINIRNLHIFDEPRELGDYYGLIPKKINDFNGSCYINESIEKAPQNMMYAIDDNDNEYILISIQPQWLCKILNGEKTIEIRKKVLRGMLDD